MMLRLRCGAGGTKTRTGVLQKCEAFPFEARFSRVNVLPIEKETTVLPRTGDACCFRV